MAPFTVLSFGIECAGRKSLCPEPIDPAIQVANLVTCREKINHLFGMSCLLIVGVDVMSFDTEREVLLAWRFSCKTFFLPLDLFCEVDPNIIIGCNICKFDLPYLIQRAEALEIAEFPILGRVRNSRVCVKDTTFSSRQYGTRK